MDKSFLHIIFLLLNSFSFAQNLVPNGSFEEYYWCPDYNNGFYIDAAKYWSKPTLGTSDYFNECSTYYDTSLQRYMFSVPENYIGYQEARTGSAYSGLAFTQVDDPSIYWVDQTFAEYIQVELTEELKTGKFYELTFYVSNPDTSRGGNSIGALFLTDEMNEIHDKIIQQQPQIQSDPTVFFCDSTKWFEIKQPFLAMGGERFLIIGVFTALYSNLMSDYSGNVLSSPGELGAIEYYYIDDVSLAETDLELPNVFTPNNDGVNDSCSFDVLKSFANELRVLNRWGETVFLSDSVFSWDGKSPNGNDCSEGVYYYCITLKNDTVFQGFISLVR